MGRPGAAGNPLTEESKLKGERQDSQNRAGPFGGFTRGLNSRLGGGTRREGKGAGQKGEEA